MSAADPPGARGLGKHFVRGTAFISVGAWLGTAFTIATNILLARILGPEVVGFYAFVFAFHEIIGALGALSLGLTLIQSQEAPPRLFDTAFSLFLLIGLVLLGVSAVVAVYLAASHSTLAAIFLMSFGASRILSVCARIPLAHLERQVRYARAAAVNLACVVVPGVAALGVALGAGGPWPYLVRDATFGALLLGLGIALSGYRPHLRWNAEDARELLSFSRHLYFARNLEIALQRSDRIVLGSWLGDGALGIYSQARTFAEMPVVATTPVNRVAFNLFARSRDDPARLARAVFILHFVLLRAVTSLVVVLLAFPEELIRVLLGDEWLEAAPILRTLAGLAVLQPVFGLLRSLLQGRGAPQLVVRIRAAQLALFLPLVAGAAVVGSLLGAALALLGVAVLGVVAAAYLNRDLLRGQLPALLTAPVLSAALAVGLAWSPLAEPLRAALPAWLLIFMPPLVYGLGLFALDRRRMLREVRYLWGMAGGSGTP